jgi:hypothetical protein
VSRGAGLCRAEAASSSWDRAGGGQPGEAGFLQAAPSLHAHLASPHPCLAPAMEGQCCGHLWADCPGDSHLWKQPLMDTSLGPKIIRVRGPGEEHTHTHTPSWANQIRSLGRLNWTRRSSGHWSEAAWLLPSSGKLLSVLELPGSLQ